MVSIWGWSELDFRLILAGQKKTGKIESELVMKVASGW
jgi:hypothetical protein